LAALAKPYCLGEGILIYRYRPHPNFHCLAWSVLVFTILFIPAIPQQLSGDTLAAEEAADPAFSPGQTPSPPRENPPSSVTNDFENTPLTFNRPSPGTPRSGERSHPPSIYSIVLYVFLFSAGFILVIWLMKRFLPGHRQLFAHPALEILGRTNIDPRRYVSLLRVGKRLLILGVTPDNINPLGEITDGNEVVEIMEQARPATPAGRSVFQSLFQRHILATEEERVAGELERGTNSLASDLSNLRQRIRSRNTGEEVDGIDRIG
jgi:flagellar biosynthetic protein FliO